MAVRACGCLEGPVQGMELVVQGCGQRAPALLPSMLCACGVSCRAGHPERLGFAGPQVLSLLKAHLVSPRAPGRASGCEPWTARGEAGFAEWPSSEWEGGLGPGGEGPTCRPRSQPRLGPHPSHVPPHPHDIFKLCPAHAEAEGPAAKRGGGAPEAGHPACGFSPPPSGARSPSPSRRRRRRGPGRSACSIYIVPGFSPAALLPAGHLPPC